MLDSALQQALAETHRATVRAGVMQVLLFTGLSQREVARLLNVSEAYLSRFLANEAQMISAPLVKKMIDQFKPPKVLQDQLLWHLEQYHKCKKLVFKIQLEEPSLVLMTTVSDLRIDGLLHSEATESKRLFLRCQQYGHLVLQNLLFRRAYYLAARVALVLNDIAHSLDRLVWAMFYARLARELLERTDTDFDDAGNYLLNAIYAEGVTLRLLGFSKQARQKQQEIIVGYPESHWFSHALREDMMAYLLNSHIERSVANQLLKRHLDSIRHLQQEEHAIWRFTADRNQAQILAKTGELSKALELMKDLYKKLLDTSGMTVVHRASFFRLYGAMNLSARQIDIGLELLQDAWQLAHNAGLTHQKNQILYHFEQANILVIEIMK